MSQTGQSTPASLSCSAILEDLQRNGLYLGIEQHHGLVDSAKRGLEEDFRRRLTTWLFSRAPQSHLTSPSASDGQEALTIEAKVDVLVKKFDFTMRCKDDDRESMLRDMLDLAKMMMMSEW